MSNWNNETSGWVKIAEGETKEFTINSITEKEPHGKINGIPGKSYFYEFGTDIGTMTVNNLGLFNALIANKVRQGDRIKATYIKKGTIGNPSKYQIEIIKKAPEENIVETASEIFNGTKEPFDKQF